MSSFLEDRRSEISKSLEEDFKMGDFKKENSNLDVLLFKQKSENS